MDWDSAIVIPGLIARIKTATAGGWQIVIDVPEIAAEQIRQLIGTEQHTVYSVGFCATGEVLEDTKRPVGRPRKQDDTEG